MPHNEQTHSRPPHFSYWHRTESIQRFVGSYRAKGLTMIDIDGIYAEAKHPYDRPPVALVETARVWADPKYSGYEKKSQILYQLCKRANLPGFVVLYIVGGVNPSRDAQEQGIEDIQLFFVRQIYPERTQKDRYHMMTPLQYALFLVWLRQEHQHIRQNPYQMYLSEFPVVDHQEIVDRWLFHKELQGEHE